MLKTDKSKNFLIIFFDTEFETFTIPKYFRCQIFSDTESDTFLCQIFQIPNPIFFFFDFFSDTESDTFFETKFFQYRIRYHSRIGKVSKTRSFKMSHSGMTCTQQDECLGIHRKLAVSWETARNISIRERFIKRKEKKRRKEENSRRNKNKKIGNIFTDCNSLTPRSAGALPGYWCLAVEPLIKKVSMFLNLNSNVKSKAFFL